MPKTIWFLACLAYVVGLFGEPSRPVRFFPGRGGLVLVAVLHDGFALAADGSSTNADGTVSQTQRILPVGKSGAIAFAGEISMQDPVSRPVREEVNIVRIAKAWLDAHPDADVQAASLAVNDLVSMATTKFFVQRAPGAAAGKYKFQIVFAGFVEGKKLVLGTRYFMPKARGLAMKAETISAAGEAAAVWVLGESKTARELMEGSANGLKQFQGEAAIPQIPSSSFQNMPVETCIDVFESVLSSVESNRGRKFDGSSAVVAPPNRFATITKKDGFSWRNAEIRRVIIERYGVDPIRTGCPHENAGQVDRQRACVLKERTASRLTSSGHSQARRSITVFFVNVKRRSRDEDIRNTCRTTNVQWIRPMAVWPSCRA